MTLGRSSSFTLSLQLQRGRGGCGIPPTCVHVFAHMHTHHPHTDVWSPGEEAESHRESCASGSTEIAPDSGQRPFLLRRECQGPRERERDIGRTEAKPGDSTHEGEVGKQADPQRWRGKCPKSEGVGQRFREKGEQRERGIGDTERGTETQTEKGEKNAPIKGAGESSTEVPLRLSTPAWPQTCFIQGS